jgi:hypothetical protein
MNLDQLKQRIEEAIQQLMLDDVQLLKNDINERTIAHQLAIYLKPMFQGFDVDCEYNGNIDAIKKRKYILILNHEAKQLGKLKKNEINKEIISRNVYPDIIIHKRSTNDHNLLIIEIKKSSNNDNGDYDRLKLRTYTSNNDENTFPYPFGLFLYFETGANPDYDVEWYRDGGVIDQ